MLHTFESLSPTSTGLIIASAIAVLGYLVFVHESHSLPLVNGKQPFEIRLIHAKRRFLFGARGLIRAGLDKWPAFEIATENGYRVILGPQYANEVRSHEALSFGRAVAHDFHAQIPGFEPFKEGTGAERVLQDVVRMRLTQSLGAVTKPLSDETAHALQTNWGDSPEWQTIPLKTTILSIVSQLSSKVFLGDQICRNPDWLRITVAYAVDSFFAAEALRLWPSFLRSLVAPFLPTVRKIQSELEEARQIIAPVLERRKAEKQAATERGREPEAYHDAMEWMEQCAKGREYDAAVAQLSLSLAAIHTTSDMLTQVLYDICACDGLIEEMRKEIVDVIRAEGWTKMTLNQLKLMDSVLKESQRLKPTTIATMRRMTVQPLRLSDGTTVPKNRILFVSCERMWDPTVYPSPEKFDPHRFLKLRQVPGHETSAQLVAPSPEHMGFGLGKHACPGRFFAANELKIALCHILIKYDLRFSDEWRDPKPFGMGLAFSAEPRATVQIRRRGEEIEL
ncbi:cytochrome P450 [Aspergillus pseudodeflectus]|uniref:Cytochrome P450 n=1 Tax=Aspergillus pseudodeflectus TaxID=176178 RepID=A0ABR4L246_9EURO